MTAQILRSPPLTHMGDLGPRLLASVWPSLTCSGHWGSEPVAGRSLSLYFSNKMQIEQQNKPPHCAFASSVKGFGGTDNALKAKTFAGLKRC